MARHALLICIAVTISWDGKAAGLMLVPVFDYSDAETSGLIDFDESAIAIGDRFFVSTRHGLWLVPNNGSDAWQVSPLPYVSHMVLGESLLVADHVAATCLAKNEEGEDFVVRRFGPWPHLIELRGKVYVKTTQGLWHVSSNCEGQVLVRGNVLVVEELGASLLVGTDEGLYRIATSGGQPAMVAEGGVAFVKEFEGSVYVGTNHGLLLLSDYGGQAELLVQGMFQFVAEVGGVVFHYRNLDHELRVSLLGGNVGLDLGIEGRFRLALEVGGAVLVGTSSGVWRLPSADGQVELLLEGEAEFITDLSDGVYIGTSQGVMRLPSGTGDPNLLIDGAARFAKEAHDRVFVGTSEALWRVPRAGRSPERVVSAEVALLALTDDGVVLGAFMRSGELWRAEVIDGDVERIGLGVGRFVKEIGDQLFIGTDTGVWRLTSGASEPDLIVSGSAVSATVVGGDVLAVTSNGIFRLSDTDGDAEPLFATSDSIRNVWSASDRTMIETTAGVFEVLKAAPHIVALHVPAPSWLREAIASLLPDNLVVGTRVVAVGGYVGADAGRIPELPRGHFSSIIDVSQSSFRERVSRGAFVPDDVGQMIRIGYPTFAYVAVRDGWGNQSEQTMDVIVLPSEGVMPIVALFLVHGLMLLALAGAPYSLFLHNLLMNPYMRGFASFGVVFLILTLLPATSRHVLRRYRRGLLAGEDIRGWEKRFVSPQPSFTASYLLQVMSKQRRILISGHSGVGKTAALRHLAATLARKRVSLGGRSPLPVYVPLGRYGSIEDVGSLIAGQLENFGGVTDRRLSESMMRNVGFVFLFDGLNEVSERCRQRVAKFADDYSENNWVVAASQESHPLQFGHWGAAVAVPTLSRKAVEFLLARRLGKARASEIVASEGPAGMALLMTPQNLELVLDLIHYRGELYMPQTEEELYEAVFERQFEVWRRSGVAGFAGRMSAEAYRMLVFRDSASLPSEVQDPLIERKLLRRLGEGTYFRHDSLRAFAASLHFVENWRTELDADGLHIDRSWDQMLRFTALQLLRSDQGVLSFRSMLWSLLPVAPEAAARLFDWFEAQHREEVIGDRGEFDRVFGRITRERMRGLGE